MSSKGALYLTVIAQGMDLNRDEGSGGNIQTLKKIRRGDGKVYTKLSRQALTYEVRKKGIEERDWQQTTVKFGKKREGKESKVIQYNIYDNESNEELDLFGFMDTDNETVIRSASITFLNAVSLEPYYGDMSFNANHDMVRRAKEQGLENPTPNPYTMENHLSLYKYSVIFDLDKIGQLKLRKKITLNNKIKNITVDDLKSSLPSLDDNQQKALLEAIQNKKITPRSPHVVKVAVKSGYVKSDDKSLTFYDLNEEAEKGKGGSEFSEDEFEEGNLNSLCEKIKSDDYGLTLSSEENSIEWLNKILKQPSFYEACLKKSGEIQSIKDNKEIQSLLKKVKSKPKLSETDNKSIARLNRLLLENVYHDNCPKSGTRTEISWREDIILSNDSCAKRIKDVLYAIHTLSRRLQARTESLVPILVMGGISSAKTILTHNFIDLENHHPKKLNLKLIEEAEGIGNRFAKEIDIEGKKQKAFIKAVRDGFFDNLHINDGWANIEDAFDTFECWLDSIFKEN